MRRHLGRIIDIGAGVVLMLLPVVGMSRSAATTYAIVVLGFFAAWMRVAWSRGRRTSERFSRCALLVLVVAMLVITSTPLGTSLTDRLFLIVLAMLGALAASRPRTARTVLVQMAIFGVLLAGVDRLIWPQVAAKQRESAYAQSAYWSPAFARESLHVTTIGPRAYDQTHIGVVRGLSDFRGRWITIVDGKRVTLGGPTNALHRIHVFGGSTTVCAEVPDQYTWPTQLQAQVKDARFAVVNHGVFGATALDRLRALRAETIRPGDVVVFYIGVNDSRIGMVQQNGPNNLFARWTWGRVFLERLSRVSRVARDLYPRTQRLWWAPESYSVDRRVIRLASALKMAQGSATGRGAHFIAVLQPNLYVSRHWSGDDDGMSTAVQDFYDAARIHLSTIFPPTDRVAKFVDASTIFDSLTLSPFVDWNHVNEIGNRVVAAEILRLVLPLIDS